MTDDSRPNDLKPEIITDLDENDIFKAFEERTDGRFLIKKAAVLEKDEAKEFSPMMWPMMDDGKGVSTNAIGYPTGGWFALQKKAEEEKRAQEEALEQEKHLEEIQAQEKENEVQRLTAQAVEQIRQDAYNEGFSQGLKEGQEKGYQEGFPKGEEAGFQQGFEQGQKAGVVAGQKQGREEGFTQGQREGLDNAKDLVEAKVARFAHLGDMLANPIRELNKDVIDEIFYIISRLCSVILHRELKGDVENLKEGIAKCLELIPNAEKGATVTLSPDDYDLILANLGRDYLKAQKWDLQSSDKLSAGDVEVSNDISLADFKVNDRIDALLEGFLQQATEVSDRTLRESIPEAPEYNEIPKKPLAPPPDLMAYEDNIKAHLQDEKINESTEGQALEEPLVEAKAPTSAQVVSKDQTKPEVIDGSKDLSELQVSDDPFVKVQ